MASPRAKYSNNASITTSASPKARMAVEPHSTSPTTNGISTAAVTTRFQVIERDSPENSQFSSHHIERNKSRGCQGNPEVLGSRQERILSREILVLLKSAECCSGPPAPTGFLCPNTTGCFTYNSME